MPRERADDVPGVEVHALGPGAARSEHAARRGVQRGHVHRRRRGVAHELVAAVLGVAGEVEAGAGDAHRGQALRGVRWRAAALLRRARPVLRGAAVAACRFALALEHDGARLRGFVGRVAKVVLARVAAAGQAAHVLAIDRQPGLGAGHAHAPLRAAESHHGLELLGHRARNAVGHAHLARRSGGRRRPRARARVRARDAHALALRVQARAARLREVAGVAFEAGDLLGGGLDAWRWRLLRGPFGDLAVRVGQAHGGEAREIGGAHLAVGGVDGVRELLGPLRERTRRRIAARRRQGLRVGIELRAQCRQALDAVLQVTRLRLRNALRLLRGLGRAHLRALERPVRGDVQQQQREGCMQRDRAREIRMRRDEPAQLLQQPVAEADARQAHIGERRRGRGRAQAAAAL